MTGVAEWPAFVAGAVEVVDGVGSSSEDLACGQRSVVGLEVARGVGQGKGVIPNE